MPLGKDLATIRAQQNLSIEDIHDSTRIPVSTIQEIETESIFYDDHRNTTYMRSFVRTYAKALKIDDTDAVKSLDQMAENTYAGLIRKKYGDGKPTVQTSKPDSGSTSESNQPEGKTSSKTDSKHSSEKKSDSQKKFPEKSDSASSHGLKTSKVKTADESKQKEEISTRYAGETKTTTPPGHTPGTGDVPDVKSINWADTGRRLYTFRSNKKYVISSVVVLILVIIGGYFLFQSDEELAPESKLRTETMPDEGTVLPETEIDTNFTAPDVSSNPNVMSPDRSDIDSVEARRMVNDTQSEDLESQSNTENQRISTSSNGVLPDTLQLIVYAANEKLEPVRVRSDVVENYSPYWIEKGVAMRFEFITEIQVRGQYTRMALFVNGNYMENFRDFRGQENEIFITRDIFEDNPENWIPRELSVAENGIAPPDTVINRPTF